MMKKMIVTGANGFLGKELSRWFSDLGWEVIGLTRRSERLSHAKAVQWDGRSPGDWMKEFEGADVVVNLAGRSVNCRYHQKNREEIFSSRLESTKVLGDAIGRCENPPKFWLNSSTATIYRHAEDRPMDEENGELGSGFSVEVAKAWEKTFFDCDLPDGVRRVALRSAIVLANEKGTVFDYLRTIARMGLGGAWGMDVRR